MFGFKNDFWTIPTVNMTYTKSQTHTNMVVDKHGIQDIRGCDCYVVAFDTINCCFCPPKCTSLIIILTSGLSKYTFMLLCSIHPQCWNLKFETYAYRTCPKMVIEALMIEHFGVHHKGHKPSPTLGHQWN